MNSLSKKILLHTIGTFFLALAAGYILSVCILIFFLIMIYMISETKESFFSLFPLLLSKAIYPTFLIALFFTSSTYFENKEAYKIYTKPGEEPPMAEIQKRELCVNTEIAKCFSLCLEALNCFEQGFKKVEQDSQNYMIRAITKKSPRSTIYGETITISLNAISDFETNVLITSSSNILFKLLDRAKNIENINKIVNFLKNKLFAKRYKEKPGVF